MPLVSPIKVDSTERAYESVRERYSECVDHYVSYHPHASWSHLAQIVYELAMEHVADLFGNVPDRACLRQLIPFLPPHG